MPRVAIIIDELCRYVQHVDLSEGDVAKLQAQLLEGSAGSVLGKAELLNPVDDRPHARFLAFRDGRAQRWCAELDSKGIVTDVRGDVLRIGFGLYHDEEDIEALIGTVRLLA